METLLLTYSHLLRDSCCHRWHGLRIGFVTSIVKGIVFGNAVYDVFDTYFSSVITFRDTACRVLRPYTFQQVSQLVTPSVTCFCLLLYQRKGFCSYRFLLYSCADGTKTSTAKYVSSFMLENYYFWWRCQKQAMVIYFVTDITSDDIICDCINRNT